MEPGKPRSVRQTGKSRLALVVLSIYWVGIFIASHIPKSHVPKGWEVSGARVHAGAYFVLALLVFVNAGLFRRVYLTSKKTWLLVGVIAAYAGLDEFLQVFAEGRDGSPVDWVIDVAACLFCVGLLWVVGLLRLLAKRADQAS